MPRLFADRRSLITLGLFLLIAALLYLATLDNGLTPGDLQGGDLITHQYAQAQARPSNAPGYPLYTMGGWLWFHGLRLLLPGSNPVAVLSSYSTVWALVALGLLFALLYRVTNGNLVITLGSSIFYAVTYFFWFYAVSTEQYASAVAQTLAIVLLVHVWDRDPRDRYLYTLAFLLGLALAHLITVLAVLPGVLVFVLRKQPGVLRRGRLVAASLALACLPLLSYGFVYIRGAQHPEWRGAGNWTSTWHWFVSFVSTRQGRGELTWSLGPLEGGYPQLIWQELTLLVLVLGVAGWFLLGRRFTLLYGLTALIYLVFSYIDRLGNWYQVILPLYPLVVVGAGVPLARLWAAYPHRLWRLVLAALLLALILPKALDNFQRADQRDRADDTGLVPGQVLLAANPPPGAAILGTGEERLALDYLTGIWGLRSDLRPITTRQAGEVLATKQPLLVSLGAANYAAAETKLPLRYTAWGPDLLLASTGSLPVVPIPGAGTVSQPLDDGLRLVGFEVVPVGAAGQWDVRLAFRADAIPTSDWSLSVRPLLQDTELSQQDHPALAAGFMPTTSLRPGETALDAFRFNLPPNLAPDAIRLILYRRLPGGKFDNLTELVLPVPGEN